MHGNCINSELSVSISTSLCGVCLFVDGRLERFRRFILEPKAPYADVSGVQKIEYDFEADGKEHEIFIMMISDLRNVANIDSGEKLHAVSCDIGDGRITLAYIEPEVLDFEVKHAINGLILRANENTASQTLKFGVCWIDTLPSPNDIQTWLGADVK